MSLPPQILRIKRKADEDPVEALYLHKRRATTDNFTAEQDFVFRRVISPRRQIARPSRHQQTNPEDAQPKSNGIPQLIATRPGEENDFIAKHRQGKPAERSRLSDTTNSTGRSQPVPSQIHPQHTRATARSTSQVPRRFHLSKLSTAALVQQTGKRKREVAVFVSETVSESVTIPSNEKDVQDERPQKRQETMEASASTVRPRKRPGATAATPTSGTPRKQEVQDTSPHMQSALQQYAMEEFGITYGKKVVQKVQADVDITMKDDSDIDDSEYIYDTYERHEVSDALNHNAVKGSTMMDTQPHAPGKEPQSYGILVIPEEQEELFLEIYGEDVTSDDEGDWDSEQDDENAENYYAADYPEDEVASDDERGYGAYERYNRRAEASDDEDYESEGVHSVEEDGGKEVRYPWARHAPWETRSIGRMPAEHSHGNSDSEDDDDDNE